MATENVHGDVQKMNLLGKLFQSQFDGGWNCQSPGQHRNLVGTIYPSNQLQFSRQFHPVSKLGYYTEFVILSTSGMLHVAQAENELLILNMAISFIYNQCFF